MIYNWYKISERANQLRPFNFIISARGIGKTYGCIDWLITNKIRFLYLRNTDTQIEECSTAFGNPFKRWNLDKGRDIRIMREKKHSLIVENSGETVDIYGYGASLSTFSKLRGVDLSDVKAVLFDEFIERGTLKFDQFTALTDLYETVNRNRELMGEKPLQVILLSNAQNITNPILRGFGLTKKLEKMLDRGQTVYSDERIFVELPQSDVSEAKKETDLYQVIKGSRYYDQAIENRFSYNDFSNVNPRKLAEYRPICGYKNITVYGHKSRSEYYCAAKRASVRYFDRSNRQLFMRMYGETLTYAYYNNSLYFENYTVKTDVLELLKLSENIV